MNAPLTDEKHVAPSVGPWEVQEVLDSREFDENCAKVLLIHGPGGDIAYAAHYSINGNTAKQQANARLIAAAPELLEALKLLYREMELSGNAGSKDYGWPKAILASREAIAKAEGRS